jgi:hypothetical protein
LGGYTGFSLLLRHRAKRIALTGVTATVPNANAVCEILKFIPVFQHE